MSDRNLKTAERLSPLGLETSTEVDYPPLSSSSYGSTLPGAYALNFRASLTKTQNERAAGATFTEDDENKEKEENEEKELEAGLNHTPSNLSP